MTPASPTTRSFVKHGRPLSLQRLLQTLLVREALAPSRAMWLVSPWLSDVTLLHNDTLAFEHVDATWPQGPVGLVDVLASSLRRGTRVCVVTRPAPRKAFASLGDTQTAAFLDRLAHEARAHADLLRVVRRPEEALHAKAWLTDHWYLRGSMNFTYSGVSVSTENLDLSTDESTLAHARAEFQSDWGQAS